MAFKHYGGSVPRASAAWNCPACGRENLQPLEQGCGHCGAGADGKREAKKAQADQNTLGQLEEPAKAAFEAWARYTPIYDEGSAPVATFGGLREAWMAGAAWARQAQEHVTDAPVPAPQKDCGQLGIIVNPGGEAGGWMDQETVPLDQPTLQTILVALAFYRDNALNYGAVPGQLSAQEVTVLITRLTPEEDPR